jgi:hypothetical protein
MFLCNLLLLYKIQKLQYIKRVGKKKEYEFHGI